jgi:hypothetical protein
VRGAMCVDNLKKTARQVGKQRRSARPALDGV